jgi:hypothetical protein
VLAAAGGVCISFRLNRLQISISTALFAPKTVPIRARKAPARARTRSSDCASMTGRGYGRLRARPISAKWRLATRVLFYPYCRARSVSEFLRLIRAIM